MLGIHMDNLKRSPLLAYPIACVNFDVEVEETN